MLKAGDPISKSQHILQKQNGTTNLQTLHSLTQENLTKGNTQHAIDKQSVSNTNISENVYHFSQVPKNQDILFLELSARDLYLEIRSQLINQTDAFMNDKQDKLTFEEFKEWLNIFPFIRSQIRESMMPRMWSLDNDYSIPQLKYSSVPKIVSPSEINPEADTTRQNRYTVPSSSAVNKPNSQSNFVVKNKGSQSSFTNLAQVNEKLPPKQTIMK